MLFRSFDELPDGIATPVLVLRFEAEDEAALARIQGVFRERLQALLPGAALPF